MTKREIVRRWGVGDLLDVLKEVDYLTGFTDELTTVATRENLSHERVRRCRAGRPDRQWLGRG